MCDLFIIIINILFNAILSCDARELCFCLFSESFFLRMCYCVVGWIYWNNKLSWFDFHVRIIRLQLRCGAFLTESRVLEQCWQWNVHRRPFIESITSKTSTKTKKMLRIDCAILTGYQRFVCVKKFSECLIS